MLSHSCFVFRITCFPFVALNHFQLEFRHVLSNKIAARAIKMEQILHVLCSENCYHSAHIDKSLPLISVKTEAALNTSDLSNSLSKVRVGRQIMYTISGISGFGSTVGSTVEHSIPTQVYLSASRPWELQQLTARLTV